MGRPTNSSDPNGGGMSRGTVIGLVIIVTLLLVGAILWNFDLLSFSL